MYAASRRRPGIHGPSWRDSPCRSEAHHQILLETSPAHHCTGRGRRRHVVFRRPSRVVTVPRAATIRSLILPELVADAALAVLLAAVVFVGRARGDRDDRRSPGSRRRFVIAAGRPAQHVPPRVPCVEIRRPVRTSRCSTLAINSIGMSVLLGDLTGADRRRSRLLREVFHRDQRVIRLFRQPQHIDP